MLIDGKWEKEEESNNQEHNAALVLVKSIELFMSLNVLKLKKRENKIR